MLGSVQPDWTGGWNNEFRIKNVTLSALLDIHEGGSIFSVTNFFGVETGVLASTLHGREKIGTIPAWSSRASIRPRGSLTPPW